MGIKEKISSWSNRDSIPKYTKYKKKPEASHLVKYKDEKEYEYYQCDYCGQEIIIKKKLEEQDGGIAILPNTITNRGAVKVVMHNKCLKPFLKDVEWGGIS